MRSLYFSLIAILFILLLSNCSKLSSSAIQDLSINPTQEEQVKKTSVSLLNMTDLEIIKKTADYLKSRGETLTFQETEINYFHNETESVVCKDDEGRDVVYKGDYLQIIYYPHPDTGGKEQHCIIVFMGEGGKVLGYCKDNSPK